VPGERALAERKSAPASVQAPIPQLQEFESSLSMVITETKPVGKGTVTKLDRTRSKGSARGDGEDKLATLIEKTVEVDSWAPESKDEDGDEVEGLRLAVRPRIISEEQEAAPADDFDADANALILDNEFNTEAYARIVDNPFLAVGDNPLSTFSIDVDTASYANVRRFLNQGVLPPPDAVRIEELINYFRYDYAGPEGDVPFSSHVEVAGCPWAPEHRLVRVALKGREIQEQNRPASNLVFLLDVSGSMEPENKLPLLKKAMRLLVERLGENDRVAIVVYAGASGLVLPSTTANNQETIHSALDELHAGGSTNGASGIQLAYDVAVSHFIKGGTNRVILCTDGDFNVGITDEGQLHRLIEEKAKSGVFLSVLGFGMGNLKDANLEMLSGKGNGNYAYIDTLSEARKVLVEEMGGTLVTIAKDVKIQVEFNPKEVAVYRLIGYENRVLAAEDFNDDTKDAGEIGAGHTVTALYEIAPAAPHPNPPPQEGGGDVAQRDVDPLKYQKPAELAEAALEGELMELKLRYKEPDGDVSKLLTFPVKDEGKGFAQASGDFKFAASVAGFGMLLRGSPYKGNATLDAVLEIAEDGKGADALGYRAEFLELVTKAKTVSVRELTAEDAEDAEK
jgi:Ca-activated chloride channel family protein